MAINYIERNIKNLLINRIEKYRHDFPNPYTDNLADAIIRHIWNDYWTVDVGVDYWKNRALEAEAKLKALKAGQETIPTLIVNDTTAISHWPPLFDKAHTVIPNEPKSPTEAEKPKRKSFFNFK